MRTYSYPKMFKGFGRCSKDSEDVQRIRKMYKGFAVSNGASCGNLDVRLFQHSSLTDGVYSVSHVMQSRLYVGLCQDFKGCGEPMLSSMIRILLKSSMTYDQVFLIGIGGTSRRATARGSALCTLCTRLLHEHPTCHSRPSPF